MLGKLWFFGEDPVCTQGWLRHGWALTGKTLAFRISTWETGALAFWCGHVAGWRRAWELCLRPGGGSWEGVGRGAGRGSPSMGGGAGHLVSAGEVSGRGSWWLGWAHKPRQWLPEGGGAPTGTL